MSTILVTGANGFVGRHLVQRLAGGGFAVRAMVRDRARLLAPPSVEVVEGDVTRPQSLTAVVEGVDIVIHSVAITGEQKEPYRGAYDRVNRVGTENLAAAARAAGVKRLISLSGLGNHPDKAGTYMATRWGMDEAVRNSGIPYFLVQPSVQFGDGSVFVSALVNLARQSPVMPLIGGGSLRFQPIWVEDVVTCIIQGITEDRLLGRAIEIGGSEFVTFREVIEVIVAALGKKRTMVTLPVPVARLQARLLGAIMSHPPLTSAALELFGFDNVTALDAVDKEFGFHPRGFREHIAAHGLTG